MAITSPMTKHSVKLNVIIDPLKLAQAGVLAHSRLRSKMPKKNLNWEIVMAKSCRRKMRANQKEKATAFYRCFLNLPSENLPPIKPIKP